MKNCIKCGMYGVLAGMLIGGVVVAKNKQLAQKINEGTNTASQKMEELKTQAQEKIQQAEQKIEEIKENRAKSQQEDLGGENSSTGAENEENISSASGKKQKSKRIK